MLDDLTGLPAEDLDRLADLIGAGRLGMPPLVASLSFLGLARASAVAGTLARLAADGFSAAQTTVLLRAVATARRRNERVADRVDLVASGPDSAATARDTAIVVDELFAGASRSVLVVGFALHDGRAVFRVLAERMEALPGLEVTCCLDVSRPVGDSSRDEEIVWRFGDRFATREWPGHRLPRVYYDPRALAPHASGLGRAVLHAKAIVVDDERALVTSANLTLAAQTRNIELGLLARDPAIAVAVRRHFARLIGDGVLVALPLP